jgi:hypothetical protein
MDFTLKAIRNTDLILSLSSIWNLSMLKNRFLFVVFTSFDKSVLRLNSNVIEGQTKNQLFLDADVHITSASIQRNFHGDIFAFFYIQISLIFCRLSVLSRLSICQQMIFIEEYTKGVMVK